MSYPPPPPPDSPGPPGPPGSWGGQPPNPGPGYGPPYGQAPQSNQKALWAMIIGIVAIPLGCCACLGWTGIAAIILGGKAKQEIAASGGLQTGEGQAQAGVIMGWIAVVFGTIVLAINIILVMTGDGSFNYDFSTT